MTEVENYLPDATMAEATQELHQAASCPIEESSFNTETTHSEHSSGEPLLEQAARRGRTGQVMYGNIPQTPADSTGPAGGPVPGTVLPHFKSYFGTPATEGAGSSNLPFDPLQAPDNVRGPAEETPTAQANVPIEVQAPIGWGITKKNLFSQKRPL